MRAARLLCFLDPVRAGSALPNANGMTALRGAHHGEAGRSGRRPAL